MRISDWSSDVCSSDLDGDDFLDLGDADLCRGRHRLVEVARGLAEDEVAALVGLPPLDDREVGEDAAFEDIILSVEAIHFLALGDERADAGLGVEAGNARAAGAADRKSTSLNSSH